jgi:hypothetical protein
MLAGVAGESDSAVHLCRRISLTRRLDTRQNPCPQEYDRAYDNPVRGHVHEVRPINQSTDQYREPNRVKAE